MRDENDADGGSEPLSPPAVPPRGGAARGGLARLFDVAARRPVLALALLVAIQTVPALGSRDLWGGDEVRHADALRGLLRDGHAIVLRMDGEPYPDKPPLYFWFVAGLARVLRSEGPEVWFLASALSGLFFLWSVLVLARAAGADARTSFAAALVALVSPLFVLLSRTTRMDLAFSGVIVLAEAALLRAWSRDEPGRGTVVAFFLMAVACLVKGPLGLALPLAAGLSWLAWRGRLRRALRRDTAAGAAAALAVLLAWAAGTWFAAPEGKEHLARILSEQVLRRAVSGGGQAMPVWFYAACLPVVALPWAAGLFAAPWRRILGRPAWRTLAAGRREGGPGRSFLACAAASGFVVLSAASTKFAIYLMPLAAPAAILAAQGLSTLPAGRAKRAWAGIAAASLVLAAGLPFVSAVHPWPVHVEGLVPVAACLAIAGGAGFLVRGKDPGPGLAVTAAGATCAALLASLLVLPSLDPVASPRAQARVLADLGDRGYATIAFRVYPGTYSWHAGRPIPRTRDVDRVRALLASEPRVAIATSRRDWEKRLTEDAFGGLRLVHEQWIVERPYVVLVKEPGSGAGP